MAIDLALYVLADPLHAAVILASTPGSGFDDGNAVERVEFMSRSDGPWKEESLAKARIRDAAAQPLLDAMRAKAAATLKELSPHALTMTRDTGIPIYRLPSDKLKMMALADRAVLEPAGTQNMPEHGFVYDNIHRAFVIDAEVYRLIIWHAEQASVDLEAVRRVLDAGFGRVAVILAE